MSLDLTGISFLADHEDSAANTNTFHIDPRSLWRRISLVSEDAYNLSVNEITASGILLSLEIPDIAGAFFHAHRALEAYLEAVVVIPALEDLIDPIASFLEKENYRPRQVLNATFLRELRNAALQSAFGPEAGRTLIHDVSEYERQYSSLRNAVFHTFTEPPIDEVLRAKSAVSEIIETIESNRNSGR